MKNKITAGRKYMFAAMLTLALAVFAMAQTETLRVGDAVVNNEGREGKIEAIDGDMAKVRWGSGSYNFNMIPLSILKSPKKAANDAAQKEMGLAFFAEAEPYFQTIYLLYQFYKPELAEATGGIDKNSIKKATADLAQLDALCKSKYPDIANPTDPRKLKILRERYGDWCDMAARRNELLQSVTSGANNAVGQNFVERWKYEIEKALNDTNGIVWDDVQAMLFEPAKWKAKDLPKLQRLYAENGGTVPANIFDSVNDDLQQLREKIETDSKTKKWEVPPYKDAAIETFVKGKYQAAFKGIVIVKSGMDFTTWKVFKNNYGIPTEQIKQGWLLVKMPNQGGLCQARQFSVIKTYMGGGTFSAMKLNGYSEAGIYMNCN